MQKLKLSREWLTRAIWGIMPHSRGWFRKCNMNNRVGPKDQVDHLRGSTVKTATMGGRDSCDSCKSATMVCAYTESLSVAHCSLQRDAMATWVLLLPRAMNRLESRDKSSSICVSARRPLLFLALGTCSGDLASGHEITDVLLKELVVVVELVVLLSYGLDAVEDGEEGFL